MREILNIQLGQCGNNIGTKFWEIITSEHGINPTNGVYEGSSDLQLQRAEVYFNSGSQGKYVPRSIMIDLDSSTVDHIMNSTVGRLFQPDHVISGHASASNNYAKGYYTDGAELIDQIMELVRLEVENCDVLQGFQLFHSLGGGTGPGLGSLVLEKIREEWPDRIISTISIVPSPKVSENVVEPYNGVMGISNLMRTSDASFLFDNTSVCRICRSNNPREEPTNCCINRLVSQTVSTFTTCFRFPGQLNCDLRKIAVNLIPFPTLHFLMSSYAPNSMINHLYRDNNIKQIIHQLFKPKNFMLDFLCDGYARHITAGVIVRGRTSTRDVEQTISQIQNKNNNQFVDYLPDHVFSSICDINPNFAVSHVCGAAISNNSGILTTLIRLQILFNTMFNKNAYLHWYLNEGMEISQMNDALENLTQLINDYQITNDISNDVIKNEQSSVLPPRNLNDKQIYSFDTLKQMVQNDLTKSSPCVSNPPKFNFAMFDKRSENQDKEVANTMGDIQSDNQTLDSKNVNEKYKPTELKSQNVSESINENDELKSQNKLEPIIERSNEFNSPTKVDSSLKTPSKDSKPKPSRSYDPKELSDVFAKSTEYYPDYLVKDNFPNY